MPADSVTAFKVTTRAPVRYCVLLPYVGLALGPDLDGLFDILRQTDGKNVRGLGVRLEICHHDQDVLRLQRDDCT